MTSQTIIWTALPNGVIGSGPGQLLRVAVHIAPRLSTDDPSPTLGLFSDFQSATQVWPDAMPSAFTVELGGATPITIPHIVPTVDPATLVPAADARLWRAIFKDTTAVESYVYESLSKRNVVSYPLADVHDFLKSCYLGAASISSTDLPTVPLLLEKTPFGKLVDPNVYNKGDNDFPFAKFTAVLDFFKPPSPGSPAPLAVPQFEFHQALSVLAKYPSLLALLGLVVELRIPVPASLQASVPTSCTLRVAPEWSPHVSTTAITPRTHCHYTGDRFTADGGAGSDVTGGMLRLKDPHFRLIQVDVDNAALKAISLGRTIGGAVDSQETAGLPSLRSAGFSLVRSQRAGKLGSQFASADLWNTNALTGTDIDLYADDITRGYRIDVWDSRSGQWHSLNQRRGLYWFQDATDPHVEKLALDDEGYIQLGTTQRLDSPDLHLHEAFARWHGWSLSAPKPGKTIDPSDEPAVYDNVVDPNAGVGGDGTKLQTAFKLITMFKPIPGSLPRLRFGTNYRFRARAVDLAGHSLPPDPSTGLTGSPETTHVTPATPYLRFEPVGAPVAVLRAPLGSRSPGESVAHIVIRSHNDDLSQDTVKTHALSERHLAPPKISQQLAETHGMFDDPTSGTVSYSYETLAERDRGKFTSSADSQDPIEPDAQLQIPYFPDPFARGVSLLNLPGTPPQSIGMLDDSLRQLVYKKHTTPWAPEGSVTLLGFGALDAWPAILPFRVVLAEGIGAPVWNDAERVLTVSLPKAEVCTIRLSSLTGNADVQLMGIWHWMVELFNSRSGWTSDWLTTESLKALQGRNWLLTPYREVQLIHAVQQPLHTPTIVKLDASKNDEGATSAILTTGLFKVHGKSTAKIDLVAAWSEPVDDLAAPGPSTISPTAHVLEMPIHLGKSDPAYNAPTSYDAATDQVTLNGNYHPAPAHEFGDTRYRRVSYHTIATTRFREYFQAPGVADGLKLTRGSTLEVVDGLKLTRESALVEIDILNSARPAAPQVLGVVPTFQWESQTQGATSRRLRRAALRVYLDRPWYSSGDDERLGVVLPIRGQDLSEDAVQPLKPYITQWGMDPIWRSDAPHPFPNVNYFANRIPSEDDTDLTLAELDALGQATGKQMPVAVASHAVTYDAVSRHWFCDIDIDSGDSYYPFVRLALARYQPHSMNQNVKLSRVVLADFAQIGPDRTVVVTRDPAAPLSLKVAVYGETYSATSNPIGDVSPSSSSILVTAESFDPRFGNDFGWTETEIVQIARDGDTTSVGDISARATGVVKSAGVPMPDVANATSLDNRSFSYFRSDQTPQIGDPLFADAKAQRWGSRIPWLAPHLLWSGSVTLPTAGLGSAKYRLMIRELETFFADADAQNRTVAQAPLTDLTATGGFGQLERVVYADTVALN